jgi:hypothetical protein
VVSCLWFFVANKNKLWIPPLWLGDYPDEINIYNSTI